MPALDGMRVLDMTQYEAGTSCTQALAWLGADVVKIERPGMGDPGRGVARGSDPRAYFLNWNSNKRSVALDLQQPSGRDVFLKLVPEFDVFVENYGPGVVEKLGRRLRRAAQAASTADLRSDQGLRPRRALLELQVLRHDRAGGERGILCHWRS